MAVSMNTGMRSDFMISDAAMSQRMAELDEEQAMQMAQFAKILEDLDSEVAKGLNDSADLSSDNAFALNDIKQAINELKSDDEKFERALNALEAEIRRRASSADDGKSSDGVFCNKTTGEELPDDPHELAEMVVAGKLNIRDIPDELMTVELMKAIIALMIEIKMHGDIDDDEPEEEPFNPAAAAVNEQNYSREVSDQMLSELYKIIEKHNEEQSEDKVTILDGISEPVDEDETPASAATEKVHTQNEEGVFEQIIDNIADNIAEETEEALEAEQISVVSEVQAQTMQTAEQDTVSASQTQTEQAVQTDAAPVITTQTNAAPAEARTQNASFQTVQEDAVQAVQTVRQSEQSDGTQMQFGAEPQTAQKTSAAAETAKTDAADEFEGAIETFTVKESENVPEAHKADTPKAVNVSSDPVSRVKDASEELQMLKSAKLGKVESKPAETTTPLISDQPIVFTGADGRAIEVKPTEIVDQTMKIIEKAIEETKEQSEYSLVLNPEELGRITVKLIKAADGAVSVTIAAENAHTQRVLEQHSELMQNNLRNSGINLESWQTVNESSRDAYAQDYNGSSKNPYFRRDEAQNSDEDNGDRTFADIIAAM